MKEAIPIVFIHYGLSDYLEYSLRSAKYSNPDKEVHLIGDEANKSLSALVDHHHFFSESTNPKIESLNTCYYLIGSNNIYSRKDINKRDYFEYFCFLRWFVLEEFMLANKIDKVWYFDSDTMIISGISEFEKEIKSYTYDNGNMKGLIDVHVLQLYTSSVLKMFNDTPFLLRNYVSQQKHRSHTVNDMTAYRYYRQGLSSPIQDDDGVRLQSLSNIYFDQALKISNEFKTRFSLIACAQVKKIIYIDDDAYLESQTGKKIKLMTLSASWLPFVYRKYLFLRHFSDNYKSIKYVFLNMHLILLAWIKALKKIII